MDISYGRILTFLSRHQLATGHAMRPELDISYFERMSLIDSKCPSRREYGILWGAAGFFTKVRCSGLYDIGAYRIRGKCDGFGVWWGKSVRDIDRRD